MQKINPTQNRQVFPRRRDYTYFDEEVMNLREGKIYFVSKVLQNVSDWEKKSFIIKTWSKVKQLSTDVASNWKFKIAFFENAEYEDNGEEEMDVKNKNRIYSDKDNDLKVFFMDRELDENNSESKGDKIIDTISGFSKWNVRVWGEITSLSPWILNTNTTYLVELEAKEWDLDVNIDLILEPVWADFWDDIHEPPEEAPENFSSNVEWKTNEENVSLNWDSVEDAEEYEISIDGWTSVFKTTSELSKDIELQDDGEYNIKVRWVNEDGKWPWSDWIYIDLNTTSPEFVDKNFDTLDWVEVWSSGSGTISFDDKIGKVVSIEFVDLVNNPIWSWSLTNTTTLPSSNLSIDWTAPTDEQSVKIRFVVEDEYGNEKEYITSETYSIEEE